VNLLTVDYDVRRSRNAEADLVATETNYGDDDVATDAQGFIGTAAEDEHGYSLLESGERQTFLSSGNRMTCFELVAKPSLYSMTRISDGVRSSFGNCSYDK
jgi:hypothetical protein